MASGDTLFVLEALGYTPPTTNYATFDVVVDASTPPTATPVLDFDGAANEHADWHVTMPLNYGGAGLTFQYTYAMSGTDGDIVEIEFRVFTFTDASSVLTADLGIDTQTAVAIQDDPSATANEFNLTTTGALSHANAGSPAAGARMIIRATRDTAAAANANDLQLLSVLVKET